MRYRENDFLTGLANALPIACVIWGFVLLGICWSTM